MNNKGLRFDMHIAFAPKSERKLIEWVEINKSHLIEKYKVYRPRIGVFAQAAKCAEQNISGENIIPTYTCNFFAESFEEAQIIMNSIVKMMMLDPILEKYFLRARPEGQCSEIKYYPKEKRLKYLHGPSITHKKYFPKTVEKDEYYDAHIHLFGINSKEQYINAALVAGKYDMPIIINMLKEKPRPFITARWYNTSLKQALKSLENIYQHLYPILKEMGIEMKLIPEFEITKFDPDCQVTDKGWMPIPSNPFEIIEEHCIPPKNLFVN